MAFNDAPTQVFAGWSENGTDITLPLAAVPQLTAAEADAVTGDLRKVAFAIMEQHWQWWNDLVSADRPVEMTLQKGVTPINSGAQLRTVYTFSFVMDVVSQEVAAEP